MLVKSEKREVGRHGTSGERTFNIAGTAKAFKILSDGLYSDKVTAIIRELSCNAKDSHVDANRSDVPFEIHLPNSLEPWFAVTDFGIGLSNEDVLNMYSTYFASTKTNSNKVTGCLGLGSKSPFAYSDSFTVESRWEGVLTLFSCFYNEEGIPSITIMGEPMPIDEHNGLTVKLAVKDGDMREFATKAANTLDRFDPTPIVTGNTDYTIETREYMVEGTDWKMLTKENSGYNDSNINAIQGNVTYPIKRSSLGELTSTQKSIMELSIDFMFDIGELDVAANREALGYDESTIANIKAKLDIVAKEIAPLFQDKFKSCKTLWEARILFKNVIAPLPYGLSHILSDNDVGLKWKKQPLSETFKISREDIDVQIINFQKNTRGGRGQTADWGYNGTIKFPASDTILFFYDDIGHGSHSRLTHFMETNSDAVRYQHLFKTDNKKLLKKISKALGNVTLQPISNLEKRPKAERFARRVTSKVLEYTGQAYDRRDSWNPTELDLSTGGVYVMINRFKVYDIRNNVGDNNTHDVEIEKFDEIVELAKANKIIDLTDKVIYGIRKGDVTKIKDDSGWINLFDLIRDKLTIVVKKEKVTQIMADRSAYANFNDCDIPNFMESLDQSKLVKSSALSIFMKAHDYMKNRDTVRAKAISEVASKVNFSLESGKAKHDLETLWKAVTEQYPLFKMLSDDVLRGGYYSSVKKDGNYAALVEYIEMMDAKIKGKRAPRLMKAA